MPDYQAHQWILQPGLRGFSLESNHPGCVPSHHAALFAVTVVPPAPFKFALRALAAAWGLGLVAPCAWAQVDTRGAAIRLELIAEVESIRPGEPFRVGLRVQHDPGWHTYWRQPGIVGVPLTLAWTLPEGFSAGPIQWPAPERVKMSQLTAWGFARDVLLMVEIVPPPRLAPGTEVTLQAKGAWMACGRTCHPGFGDFSLSLPVRQEAAPDWSPEHRALFAAAEADLPRPLAGWKASVVTDENGTHRLRLVPESPAQAPPADASWYFYSYTPHTHSDEPQQVRVLADGGIELLLSPFPIPEPVLPQLEGVIECSTGLPPGNPHHFSVIQAPWLTHPNAP